MNKLTEVALFERNDENGHSRDLVRVCADGPLNFDSFDTGPLPDSAWGRDYEYDLDISADWKDTILLLLFKERFTANCDFRNWAKAHDIPYTEGGRW